MASKTTFGWPDIEAWRAALPELKRKAGDIPAEQAAVSFMTVLEALESTIQIADAERAGNCSGEKAYSVVRVYEDTLDHIWKAAGGRGQWLYAAQVLQRVIGHFCGDEGGADE